MSVLVARDPDRPPLTVVAGTAVVGLLAMLVAVGLPLKALPLETERADGSYRWLWTTVSPDDKNVVDDWASWNYSGYERKADYPEYYELVATMARIGEDQGCGRAMWEYENDRLNRYGTPMAPMLLPFWTDGCIGSMEGLYFEASATTPYHFINQSELSAKCSCSQRRRRSRGVDPYSGFNIDVGIEQLQLLGVRYYLAFSPTAVTAADAHPDLDPIATTSYVARVRGCRRSIVEPLSTAPAVLDGCRPAQGVARPGHRLVPGPRAVGCHARRRRARSWAARRGGDAHPAGGSPPSPSPRSTSAGDGISFDVDRAGRAGARQDVVLPELEGVGCRRPVPGGTEPDGRGPHRTHVSLPYGWTGLDIAAWLLTARHRPSLVVLVPGAAGPARPARRRPGRAADGATRRGPPDLPAAAPLLGRRARWSPRRHRRVRPAARGPAPGRWPADLPALAAASLLS